MKKAEASKKISPGIVLPASVLLFAALFAVVLAGFLSGCDASKNGEKGSELSETAAVSASAGATLTAVETPGNATETETYAPATDIAPPPTDPSEVPTAVAAWPENEYNIGTENERAALYIGALTAPEAEILTPEEIGAANRRMTEDSQSLINILNIPAMTKGRELADMMTAGAMPDSPLYDAEGNILSEDELAGILANRGADNIAGMDTVPVRPGIVVSRTDLKRFPTAKEFHAGKGTHVDLIQDTELYLGMPVWIMAESVDGAFLFVRSYWYDGWVKAEDVAAAGSVDEWLEFADPEEFAVAIDARTYIDGVQADMGVKLPLCGISIDGNTYEIKMPERGENGELTSVIRTLPVTGAHKGYLRYTYANFIAQAFKFFGTDYAWGGLKGGVDCSSYVASVMRSFGFYLPRDTKYQRDTAGTEVNISGKTESEILELIRTEGAKAPVAIYTKGHVKFYLPGPDGSDMVIHAPGSGKKVTDGTLDNAPGIVSVRSLNG